MPLSHERISETIVLSLLPTRLGRGSGSTNEAHRESRGGDLRAGPSLFAHWIGENKKILGILVITRRVRKRWVLFNAGVAVKAIRNRYFFVPCERYEGTTSVGHWNVWNCRHYSLDISHWQRCLIAAGACTSFKVATYESLLVTTYGRDD